MDVSMDPGVRVLLGVESQPRAARLLPGEVFLQGSARKNQGVYDVVLPWGIHASSLSIARRERSGDGF